MMKKVLLLTTGGTIAARNGEQGLVPDIKCQDILEMLPEIKGCFEVDSQDILNLDSSNVQPEEWQYIAEIVTENLALYDGIIITHGTDTMAYTASALSYMLQNLDKPVILTGAQIPIEKMFTDAKRNLQAAFAAVNTDIKGVAIAFDDKIINGCRAVKVRTLGFNAFESISAPYVGEVYADGMHVYRKDMHPAKEQKPFCLKKELCTDVFLLKLIPGTNPEIFDRLLDMKYRGIVIEAFGAGGTHFERRNLIPKLHKLVENGISIVACSQCLYEKSDFSMYEVGQKLLECGVIPGRDMTTEAIVTKLMWALGQTKDPQKIREIFDTDYAGEVTLG
ncbi:MULTISPECIES: asparaginase [Lachnospiraceae]|nr:asparaginase [Mediterraneibacter massiliensis]SCH51323.1 L-asparaginase 1 [uncultured Clostridium sp.]